MRVRLWAPDKRRWATGATGWARLPQVSLEPGLAFATLCLVLAAVAAMFLD